MTSENLKNPTIYTAPSIPKVGIDLELEAMRLKLAALPWLQKAFGRAWSKPRTLDGKTVLEPLLYQGGAEYYPALPNDNLKSYSFFRVNSPRVNTEGSWFVDPVDLIVWVNLKEIAPTIDWIFTESLINDVINLFDDGWSLNKIYDDKVTDIFSGYDTRDLHQGLLMYPYKGFRMDISVTYQFLCAEDEQSGFLLREPGGFIKI